MSEQIIEKYSDADTLVTAVGDRLVAAINGAIEARGVAYIVLTGGGTGIKLLKHVGGHPIDWAKVHLFWGDDRYVPADDADRNIKQAREALLDSVAIPAENVHAMAASDGEFGDDIDAAAAAYAGELAAVSGNGASTPEFDVHLLGMGGEGHVNSLFPHSDAVRETARYVVAVTDSPKPPPERVSLTFEALNRSQSVWFLVSGEAKADAARRALAEEGSVAETPARGVTGTAETIWFLDRDAASQL